MANTNKLLGKMKEHKITAEALAEELKISRSTVYRILNNEGESFTIAQVKTIQGLLKLSKQETMSIFFCGDRSKNGKVEQ